MPLPLSPISPSVVPPAPSPAPSTGAEVAIAIGQLAAGTAIQIGGVAAGVAVAKPALTAGFVLLAPAITGIAVCGIGKFSRSYDAGCGWPIAGAYIGGVAGVATGLGAGLALAKITNPSGEFAGLSMIAGGLVVGYVLGPPIGATLAWQIAKHPVLANLSLAQPAAPSAPATGAARTVDPVQAAQSALLSSAKMQFIVPVVSGRF